MRFIYTIFLAFSFLQVLGQQESLEFFNSNEINHPLRNRAGDFQSQPPNAEDSKKVVWYLPWEIKNGFVTIYTKGDTLRIPQSDRQKADFIYGCRNIDIDEKDTKWIVVYGIKNTVIPAQYDNYLIRIDSLKRYQYIYPSDFQADELAGNDAWVSATAINDVPLVIGQGYFIFGNKPAQIINFNSLGITETNSHRAISDRRNTLFYVGYPNTIVSFHSDGTYQKRLSNKVIRTYNVNKTLGRLTVLAKDSVYELEGKMGQHLDYPNYSTIINSAEISALNLSNGNYSIDVIVSGKGFIVRDGKSFTPYVFANTTEVGADSLSFTTFYTSRGGNLQEDSTLVLIMTSPYLQNSPNKTYLFTYKKGKANFHKLYQFNKLGLQYSFNLAYYVAKNRTYVYLFQPNFQTGRHSIIQLIDDTTITRISATTRHCSLYIKSSDMRADKDFLWLWNEPEPDGSPCQIARFRHDSYFIKGKVFYDKNSNGLFDVNEYGFGDIKLTAQPSGLEIFPDWDGNYTFLHSPGAPYQIEVQDTARFSSITVEGANIGVRLKEEKPTMSVAIGLPWARCNTLQATKITVKNIGVIPVDRIELRLVAEKFKLSVNGETMDTIRLQYGPLLERMEASQPYDVQMPDAEMVGQVGTIKSILGIFIGDKLVSEKFDSVQTVIRCAYDPNDKSVTPVGHDASHMVLKNQALQYQIRFENTGNDTAYHVRVVDTLSQHLDWKSFKVLNSSHTMNAQLSPDGIATFYFNYIMLPDSTTNKIKANGYVNFQIMPKPDLAEGTRICNKASIIFDSNKPIITNEACNSVYEKIPLKTKTIKGQINQILFPNPAKDYTELTVESENYQVYNILGKKVKNGSGKRVELRDLNEGSYIIKVQYPDQTVSIHSVMVLR